MEGADDIPVVPMTDGQGAEDIVLEEEEQEVQRRLAEVNNGFSPEDTRFRFRFDVKVGAWHKQPFQWHAFMHACLLTSLCVCVCMCVHACVRARVHVSG